MQVEQTCDEIGIGGIDWRDQSLGQADIFRERYIMNPEFGSRGALDYISRILANNVTVLQHTFVRLDC